MRVSKQAGASGCLRVCLGNQCEPRDRAPAFSFRRSCRRHFWVFDRWVRRQTSRSGKRWFGIFLCSCSGCVYSYFRGQHRATARPVRHGEGWSAREPDGSEIGGEPVKRPDRMGGGLVAWGISGLFFRWYEPCRMASSFGLFNPYLVA